MRNVNFMNSIARRQFLGRAAGGIGSIALSTLLCQDASGQEGSALEMRTDSRSTANGLHHPGKSQTRDLPKYVGRAVAT